MTSADVRLASALSQSLTVRDRVRGSRVPRQSEAIEAQQGNGHSIPKCLTKNCWNGRAVDYCLAARSGFHACVTTSDSPRLNHIEGPCLILAGTGMCNGGRILDLRHGLPRDNTHVFIVGYQTQGSQGRRLVEGAKSVSIFGEKISVRQD